MKHLILLFSLLSLLSCSAITRAIASDITDSSGMPFISHTGAPDSYDNALALNIEYRPIEQLRELISNTIGKDLKFFKGWDKDGEAHVTTITPPEYKNVLRKYISMRRINSIAKKMRIQSSDLQVLGIGKGRKGKDTTYFIIVDSSKLRKIRHTIYREFVKKGGNPSSFDPTWFFPHITIGYTKRDLHEDDNVVKNLKFSYDKELSNKLLF